MGASAAVGLSAAAQNASDDDLAKLAAGLSAEARAKLNQAIDGVLPPGGRAASMTISDGVTMLRSQYLAGVKEDCLSSYPTVARPEINVAAAIDGTIDTVAKEFPELEPCLYNSVKVCQNCGKPCAFTLTSCNACGSSLEGVPIGKSENVFSAFLLGVKLANKGFPYTISLRRETEEVLIFDDMLQLAPCHFNGISRKYYIPDWRFLLTAPKLGLELLQLLESELWEATQPFVKDSAFRKALYRGDVSDDFIKENIIASFNFPPSQFQLHVQWIVPPLMPFQHFMAETRNHFHEGRAFPMHYVKRVLELDMPYDVKKNTPIEDIVEYYNGKGVKYSEIWLEWYNKLGLGSTLACQNWDASNFSYVVQDGKAYNFSVVDAQVKLGDEVPDVSPKDVQVKDKAALQNYGRPYTEAGKPSGTYIQKPIEPKIGPGGYTLWHGMTIS